MAAGRGRLSFLEEWSARQQFSDGERLHNVVRPPIQGDDLVMFRAADRNHGSVPFKGQSNLAASLKPTHARRVHIQKNHIGAPSMPASVSKGTIYAGYTHPNKLGTALITYASQI
jgi:hypothetical protein